MTQNLFPFGTPVATEQSVLAADVTLVVGGAPAVLASVSKVFPRGKALVTASTAGQGSGAGGALHKLETSLWIDGVRVQGGGAQSYDLSPQTCSHQFLVTGLGPGAHLFELRAQCPAGSASDWEVFPLTRPGVSHAQLTVGEVL